MDSAAMLFGLLVAILVVSGAFLTISHKTTQKKDNETKRVIQAKEKSLAVFEDYLSATSMLKMSKVVDLVIMCRIASYLNEMNAIQHSNDRELRLDRLRSEIDELTKESGRFLNTPAIVSCSKNNYPSAIKLFKKLKQLATKEYVNGLIPPEAYNDFHRYLIEYEARIFISHFNEKIKSEMTTHDTIKARSTMTKCIHALKNYNCTIAEKAIAHTEDMIKKIDSDNIAKDNEKKLKIAEREAEMDIIFNGHSKQRW